MTLPGHQPHVAQSGGLMHEPRHLHRGLPGRRSCPGHAGVDLDDDAHFNTGGDSGFRDLRGIELPVDGYLDIGPATQIHQPCDLLRCHQLVGNQNIGYSGIHHDFRLAQLGAGDSDRSGLERLVGNGRHLIPLMCGLH